MTLDPVQLDPVQLGMAPHPEGGWYRETWRHAELIGTPRGERALVTCVSFLLQPGQESAWHRVRSAELWLWQSARPATDRPSLVACIVSPGFDFADFTLLEGA